MPRWLTVKLPGGEGYRDLKAMVAELGLHTVCQEASCPNVGECWNERELTLMHFDRQTEQDGPAARMRAAATDFSE